MKITNAQALNFVNTVNGSMAGRHLPVRVAFAIKKNMAAIMKDMIKPFEETRQELLKKREDTEESNAQFVEDINALLEEECEVSIHTISLEELEKLDADPSYDKLSLAEIDVLDFMIKE